MNIVVVVDGSDTFDVHPVFQRPEHATGAPVAPQMKSVLKRAWTVPAVGAHGAEQGPTDVAARGGEILCRLNK